MSPPTTFHERGRQIVDAAAAQLEAAIPGARRGSPRRLAGADAVYVQFRDAELPQQLSPFSWRQHIDARVEGYRWFCPVAELPADTAAAGAVIGDRVLRTLRTARAATP